MGDGRARITNTNAQTSLVTGGPIPATSLLYSIDANPEATTASLP